MSQRAKLLMASTALLAVVGLTAVTNAWFVSLSKTPAGVVRSALVRCLPESGPERDTDSLLTYGSLVSGSSVDTDGVPLVLPGDSLLSMQTWTGAARTVRTSLARDFQTGETPGTVIHRIERTDAGGITATRVQRDLMNADPDKEYETSLWYPGQTAEGTSIPDPSLDPADYTAVTTAATTVVKTGTPVVTMTTTILTVTTVYTPRTEGGASYTHVQKTIEEITHEAAVYVPDQAAFDAITGPARTLTTDETVLSVDPKVTHSYLIVTEQPASGTAKDDPTPLPLALGNLSTADVNIRVGLTATITRTDSGGADTVTPLTLRSGVEATDKNAYFLGLTRDDGAFIELFRFDPSATDSYQWVRSSDETESKTWSLFDLSLKHTASDADPLDIPPPAQPTSSPPPSASPAPTASGSPAPTPTTAPEAAEPDLYPVLDVLRVVSKSAFNVEKASFEQSFNEFYCSNAPTIRLSIHYYVRQSEYMAWSEFYSDSLSFTVPSAQ